MILVASLLCTMLLTTLGSALLLTAMAETQTAASYDRGLEVLYAADGAAERALQDLAAIEDWSDALNGTVRSSFVDGTPGGSRTLADGTAVDLTQMTNTIRCGKGAGCTDAELDAITAERPWGRDNPRWELFAYGPLNALLPGAAIHSPAYVVVWIGDDAAEGDRQPGVDGAPNADGSANAGAGVVILLAHAYGYAGSRRMVELTVARAPVGVRLLAWRELRH
jgi:hypothetical protein